MRLGFNENGFRFQRFPRSIPPGSVWRRPRAGSTPRDVPPNCLLGMLGLIVANGALLGVGTFLGGGLGAALPAIGIGATMLISLGYFARIYWNTATARGLPG